MCTSRAARCSQTPRKTANITLVLQYSTRGRKVSYISLILRLQLCLHTPDSHKTLGWKCCKPRVLTFDEFLAIPACTTGKHSTTDIPPTIEKKQVDPADAAPAYKPTAPAPEAASRAPVAPQATATSPPPPPESEDDDPSLEIPKGKTCRRKACEQQYTGERESEKCVFHPGAPIFHEGSKGYTCCKRRVLEFDEFLRIGGCKTKDRHLFVGSGKTKGAKAGGEEVLETVRLVETPWWKAWTHFVQA